MKRSGNVCVYSERNDVAIELLSVGRELAGENSLIAIVSGSGSGSGEEQLAHGADLVITVQHPEDADPVEVQIEALRQTLDRHEPDVILIGATAHGTEVASRFAQREGLGCASECTRLERSNGDLAIERTCLGRFVSRQAVTTTPAIATVQPRRFESPPRGNGNGGKIETLQIEAPPTCTPIIDTRQREQSSVRIDKADVVVGIGRGLKNKDDLRLIEELARTLGGVVGASRPLTDDLQWLSSDRKIGLSGVTVKPKLYIACGISGQIEHNVGMRESGIVVAINNDPTAPIMEQADYCLTGDLREVVPALIDAITKMSRQ